MTEDDDTIDVEAVISEHATKDKREREARKSVLPKIVRIVSGCYFRSYKFRLPPPPFGTPLFHPTIPSSWGWKRRMCTASEGKWDITFLFLANLDTTD